MRHALRLVLISSAALIALPAAAQEAPITVDPSAPIVVPIGQPPEPGQLRPPAVVPVDEPVAEAEPPAPAIPEIWAPVPTDADGRSAYGLYLSGRVAGLRGDRSSAARLLAESQALTPEQPVLGDAAFRESLFSGDLDEVVRLTPTVQDTPLLADSGRLVEVVQLLAHGDARASLAVLQSRPFPRPFNEVARYLLPGVALAAGDEALALKPLDATDTGPATLILRLQRARALESRRRFDDAEAEYRAMTAQPGGTQLYGVDFGEFLERRGRREEARAIYQQVLAGQTPEPRLLAALQRIDRRGRAPALPAPRQTVAEALQFASLWAANDEAHELAAIFLRLAESLDPSDEVALRLGQSLASANQEAPAREAFGRVSPANGIVYAGARYNMALSLQRDERPEEALAALRAADAAAPDQLMISHDLAGQLIALGRYEEALTILNRPNVNTAGQNPSFRFLRGAALERLGRVDEAEGELWTALQAQPNDPTMLNHLGYLWVDSGRRVEQGADMIARAHAADPDNGNIQDSLGWAQYRQGQYDAAVETLEQAVAKEPANAEIVDHLGDAYWQVGRRREAEWQWSRVLTLEPEPEQRAEVERKLISGLSEPEPVTGSRP
jgi:Flp pilus assembly protein TadD